jgi:hypothetical protein
MAKGHRKHKGGSKKLKVMGAHLGHKAHAHKGGGKKRGRRKRA